MARFGAIGTQYFDNAGDPLVNGRLYFYESGTSIDKDTFADAALTIPNSNPVLLSAAGRQPSIFFNGSARVVLTDKNDVQIEDRDPIGAEDVEGAFGDWNSVSAYDAGEIVTGGDGNYYQSLTNNNQGNEPATSPVNWSRVEFLTYWNTNQVYQINDPVIGSDGQIYTSLANSNSGNDPTSDAVNWKIVGTDVFVEKAGDTMTGKLNTAASTTSSAGFNLAPGVAPTSPVDGDVWVTASNSFQRIGGATKTVAFLEQEQSFTQKQSFPASTTSKSSIRFQPGVAPTAPVDGDWWLTAESAFVRISGATNYVGTVEGSWTPTVSGTSTPGSASYTTQIARYTKTGKWVSFQCVVIYVGHTGTGNITITGLPFQTKNLANYSPSFAITGSNLTPGAGLQIQASALANSTLIRLYTFDPATGTQAALAMDAAANIFISGTYEAE